MSAKDIKDKASLERWLTGRSSAESRVIAARAALVAIPALERLERMPKVLLGLRAHATVWLHEAYPELTILDLPDYPPTKGYGRDQALKGVFNAIDCIRHPTLADHTSTIELSVFAYTWYAHDEDAYEVYRSYVRASWERVRADAEALEAGVNRRTMLCSPLWSFGTPNWATEKWHSLKHTLLDRPSEHWDVWIDWYEARLRGEPGDEEEEIARVLEVTEDEWAAGPAVANKKIKGIIARFSSAPSPIPSVAANAATKGHAFISHATQADGARASALARDFEAVGLPCWIAPRDIPSGADWNGAIMSAIDACDAMILLVSDAALKSPFVKAEVQHAFERGKRVFPIRLADSIEAGEIDLRLKIVQHIDGRGETQTIVASILKSLG